MKNIIDNYEEHALHLVYDNQCSECYNCPPEVKMTEGGIALKKKLEEDSCEVEQLRDDYDPSYK